MSINWPSATDAFTNPAGTSLQSSPDHAQQHSDVNDLGEAIEAVLGTTGGTSVLRSFVAGNFAARINSSGVLQQIVSGTINNSTLGTPSITGGTISNTTLNSLTLGTPSITGGTVASAVIGATNLISFNSPQGFTINGRISVTSPALNLVVALKGLDGNDPSATNPVYVRVGGAIRTITAALSLTVNSDNNYFNAASTELASKEVDYFTYLCWDGTNNTTGIGVCRIPYAKVSADISATVSSPKYFPTSSNVDNTLLTDMVVIGRFAATLSASPDFDFTLPTYTSSNLIQHPIYQTRWLTWAPAYSASSSMTFTSVTTDYALYKIEQDTCRASLRAYGTTGGTASTQILATMPISVTNTWYMGQLVCSAISNNSAPEAGIARDSGNASQVAIYRYNNNNWTLAAATYIMVNGAYTLV